MLGNNEYKKLRSDISGQQVLSRENSWPGPPGRDASGVRKKVNKVRDNGSGGKERWSQRERKEKKNRGLTGHWKASSLFSGQNGEILGISNKSMTWSSMHHVCLSGYWVEDAFVLSQGLIQIILYIMSTADKKIGWCGSQKKQSARPAVGSAGETGFFFFLTILWWNTRNLSWPPPETAHVMLQKCASSKFTTPRI